jgi:hypothetical protein
LLNGILLVRLYERLYVPILFGIHIVWYNGDKNRIAAGDVPEEKINAIPNQKRGFDCTVSPFRFSVFSLSVLTNEKKHGTVYLDAFHPIVLF